MKKMKPETAGTTIIGSRKKTVSRPRPRNSFRNSRASAKPSQELDADGDDGEPHSQPHGMPEAPARQRFPVAVEPVPVVVGAPDVVVPNANGKPTFRCGHLERLPLATPYPGIVRHVHRLLSHPPFLGQSELVLDLTGVGRPVADLFQAEGLRPVKVSIHRRRQ